MSATRPPLLAEWACLGAVYAVPSHGFAVSKRLALSGDLGRIWQVSRPLTYRALDQLRSWKWIEPRREEPSEAGPNRTLVAATRTGRRRFEDWVTTPVAHVRDVRSELLLKVVLADEHRLDISDMLDEQQLLIDRAVSENCVREPVPDVVTAWRTEMTLATQRFIAELRRRSASLDN